MQTIHMLESVWFETELKTLTKTPLMNLQFFLFSCPDQMVQARKQYVLEFRKKSTTNNASYNTQR